MNSAIEQATEENMNESSSTRNNGFNLRPDVKEEPKTDSGLKGRAEIKELFTLSEIEDPYTNSTGQKVSSRVFDEVIKAMGAMIEVRDWYTARHQRKVACISVEIARTMALPVHQIKGIQLAAMIHDIGKLSIPTEILSKPGQLNTSEFELIKTHPSTGFAILRDIEFPWPIAQIVLQHHERINGSGYPSRLSRYEILLEARILAVADVIEAMASDRPYRPALGISPALQEITNNKHILYDGNVVEACLELFNKKAFVI